MCSHRYQMATWLFGGTQQPTASRIAGARSAVTARLGGRGGTAGNASGPIQLRSTKAGTPVGRENARTAWRQYGVAQPAPHAR